ncbi:hypothetical protein PWM41_002524 [Providencia rettgeri]|nr:hypothetical protein [Providencia rettgeri]
MLAPLGLVTVENYWNENIKEFKLVINTSNFTNTYKVFNNIKDKQVLKDAYSFVFFYEKQISWQVTFITESGETWGNDSFLPYNFATSDNGKAIIGINGDSKRLYVAFPSSSSCSMALTQMS